MDRIAKILAYADLAQLLGAPEDIHLEVKSALYDLATPVGVDRFP
jgi:hypothetical protein